MGDVTGSSVPNDDLQSELGTSPAATSTRGQRSRAINANHLLNFQRDTPGSSRGGRRSEANVRRRPPPRSSRPQAYDRGKFLQANFRFMVSDAVDIQKYEADPDLSLEWEDIAAVDSMATAPVICPITLGPPLCPCITPCGHIFSEEAIMGHMMTQGGPDLRISSSCPVCNSGVAARELRPVTIRLVPEVKVGDSISLKLLKRGRNSIIPHPVGEEPAVQKQRKAKQGSSNAGGGGSGAAALRESSPKSPSGWRTASTTAQDAISSRGDGLTCNPFAKFTAVSDPMPLWTKHAAILARKAAQLLAEGGLDASYEVPPMLSAIDMLGTRAKAWTERRQRFIIERLMDSNPDATAQMLGTESPEECGKRAMEAVKMASDEAFDAEEKVYRRSAAAQVLDVEFPALAVSARAAPSTQQSNAEDKFNINAAPFNPSSSSSSSAVMASESTENPAPQQDSLSMMFLYQSADGQPVFLCPLNLRMLVEWKGSYTALPHEISGTVLELEYVEQNESNRKRLKALTHQPLGASYKLCEIDMRNVMPEDALAPFEAEITQRAKKRAQLAKQEARRLQREAAKAKAAAAEAAAATSGPSLAELAAMPLPGREPTEPVPVPGVHQHGSDTETEAEIDAAILSSPSPPQGSVSFARIAKLGFAATGPSLSEGSPPPVWGHSPGTAAGGAWGPPLGSSAGGSGGGGGVQNSTPPGIPRPSAADTGSGVWGASRVPQQPSENAGTAGGGGKKKGKQKMLLLSTSQRRY